MLRHRCSVLAWAFAFVAAALPAGSREVHPVVLQLLDPEHRQDAFVEIVSWQKYPAALRRPTRVTAEGKIVADVVVCPQPHGNPIYAVLTEHLDDKKVITLLDDDGTLIPVYRGADVLDRELVDVNGDGVLENIGTISTSLRIGDAEVFLDELYVVPVTPMQSSVLTVAFQRRVTPRRSKPEWSWKLQATDLKGTYSIVLGPKDPESGSIEPEAVYSWSATEKRWIGPAGGSDQPFLRFEGDHSRDRREYASAALARIVAGQVTDGAGRPVSVARVRYRLAGGKVAADWSEKPFITGSDGRFELGKLEPGRGYEIRAEKSGFVSAAFVVGGEDSSTDLRIVLLRTAPEP